ncbi:phage regulatory CII family protein [Variovorax paradoxus]|uniref:Uncharacterized protein n=1 Tax=Variovorax paradoxus TaxID=34073 RepID=A0A679JND4_VARPD|nr:hypothetical protein VVAX_04362 [Variovorax paradoxus]
MNIKALLQTAVGKYQSTKPNGSNGALGLAKEVLHISNGSLSRKVNPNDDGSHCSPEEVITICRESGDHAPLQAMAIELGYVLMPLQVGAVSEMAPSLAGNFKELGEWLQAASAAASSPNGALTDNVINNLQRELFEGIFTSMQTFNEIRAKHEASKPGLRAVA